jgi:flagellar basal body-associated protein FliL
MDAKLLIIIIAAIVVVIVSLVALFLNRGRLKKLGIKAGPEGFEVDVNLESPGHNEKPEDKKKAVVEKIQQKGNRGEIQINAEDVKARDIKQDGDDNKINIG